MSPSTVLRSQRERRARIALGLIFLIGLTNYFDRIALGVLQVPIKRELGLSDSQLGLLTGLAFFIPYTLLSIPIARMADRGDRKWILAAALVVWSSMTAAISVAHGFMLIMVLRMGVAIGEAACLPTSYALLADYFPPHRRARAIAIVGMSFPLGSSVGIVGAGFMEAALGWRGAFLVLGAVGLVLAPTLLIALRDAPRGQSTAATRDTPQPRPPPPFGEAMKTLWGQRAFRFMALGAGFQTFVATTVLSWSAPFYTRIHDLELKEVALVLGIITGVGGALGSYLGGLLSDRLGSVNQRWYLWIPATACGLTVAAGLAQFLVPVPYLSFGLAALTILLLSSFAPPLYAIAHSLVAANLRALTSSLLVMGSALLGGAFGPTVTGVLSDRFLEMGAGAQALRYAICLAFVFSGAAAWLFMKAASQVAAGPIATHADGTGAAPDSRGDEARGVNRPDTP